MKRLGFLDGLRGWGAVSVLIYHAFCEGLPPVPAFEQLKYLAPFNGVFAVHVFFIVSGFALSVRYLSDGDLRNFTMIAAGRYIRLAVPIFAACALMHFAMLGGLISGDRPAKFAAFFAFEPTLHHLLRFSFFDVFFDYSNEATYIAPLWTMRPELLGSFVVLSAVLLVRPLRARLALLGVIAAALLVTLPEFGDFLALFVIGAALADGFNRGWIERLPKGLSALLIVAGCLALLPPLPMPICYFAGAVAVVLGSIALPAARQFLETPFSAYLGKISFPLYLIHGPVLNIIGEPLMRHAEGVAFRISIDLVVLVVSFLAAVAFTPVNTIAIRLSHAFGLLILNSMDVARALFAKRNLKNPDSYP